MVLVALKFLLLALCFVYVFVLGFFAGSNYSLTGRSHTGLAFTPVGLRRKTKQSSRVKNNRTNVQHFDISSRSHIAINRISLHALIAPTHSQIRQFVNQSLNKSFETQGNATGGQGSNSNVDAKGFRSTRMYVKKHAKVVRVSIDGRHDFKTVPCDVPCEWTGGGNLVTRGKILDFKGKADILMSMEGPKHYPDLALGNKEKYAILGITDHHSDIPMPYFEWDWAKYFQPEPKTEEQKSSTAIYSSKPNPQAIPKIAFMARNCKSLNNRERIVRYFQDQNLLHSLSSCLHNYKDPDLDTKLNKRQVMQKYMFYAAFENEDSDGYLTEKRTKKT